MKTEIVCSKIQDKSIGNNLQKSPIWDDCKKFDELTEEEKKSDTYVAYTIKFDGLKPVQVTKIKKLK